MQVLFFLCAVIYENCCGRVIFHIEETALERAVIYQNCCLYYLPQQFLYFFPEPQGQGSFLPTLGVVRRTVTLAPEFAFDIGLLAA